MLGIPSRKSSTPRTKGTLWLALATVLVLFQATGCFQSDTQPERAGGVPASADVPSLAEIQSTVGMSGEQSAALAPAYQSWVQSETAWSAAPQPLGEPPVLDFIASSASVLDDPQMGRLIAALHAFEAGRVADQGMEGRLSGAAGGHGPGHGGPGGPGHHGPGHGGPGHGGPGGDPFRDLGLTEAQLVQVRQAQQELHETIAALVVELRNGALTPEQFETGVEAAQAGFETALQGILTAEQYAALQQARRDRMIAHLQQRLARFDTDVARRLEALDRILELSDEQAADIQTILADSRSPLEAVLAGLRDGSLSPQAAQAALKQAERDTTAAIRATLTEAQAALFDRLIALRRLFPGCRP